MFSNPKRRSYPLISLIRTRKSLDYTPCSTPPLSPTSTNYTQEDDDDDNEPLGLLYLRKIKPNSLLSDKSEDGDDDLVPIAILSTTTTHCLSAAEKYKAKVIAKLQM